MATPKRSSTPVVPEASKTQVVVPMISMEADAGAGFEGATRESFSIPFLAVLQSGSPQCKKSDGAYIKGASEGTLLNTATGEVFDGDEGIFFVPAAYTLTYVEWQKREDGGGYRGEHDSIKGLAMLRNTRKDDKGRDILPNGNQLNATHNFYGLLIDETGGAQRVVISMTSTQIKVAKKWMTVMNMQQATRADGTRFPAPMFANIYKLTTTPQTNDKGSWFVWSPTLERALDLSDTVDVERYLGARLFKDSILKGEAKTAERHEDGPVVVDNPEEF